MRCAVLPASLASCPCRERTQICRGWLVPSPQHKRSTGARNNNGKPLVWGWEQREKRRGTWREAGPITTTAL